MFRPNELSLMAAVINGSAGALVLAGRTVARSIQPKGHKMLHRSDLLWTGRAACYACFREPSLRVDHAISCTPGTEAITGKSSLVAALHSAYGVDAAGAIMPTAFLLPEQYPAFAAHVRDAGATGVWALKEDVHRGKGVVAAPARAALGRALETVAPPPAKVGAPPPPRRPRFVMAQRFIDDQILVGGRPAVLRLWAVLAGGAPVTRALLFDGGIALLGDRPLGPAAEAAPSPAAAEDRAQALVVNIFQQNRSAAADPWTLPRLAAALDAPAPGALTSSSGAPLALGPGTFGALWEAVEAATAAALAAAVPHVRRSTAFSFMKTYQGGNVEVLGMDYVIDSAARPWLVEINYLPSMARKVADCMPPGGGAEGARASKSKAAPKEMCVPNPMDAEKERFLEAHLAVVARRHRTVAAHAEAAAAAVQARREAEDAAHAGKEGVPPSQRCSVTAEVLRQVLDADAEAAAAAAHSFSDLTPRLYRALECMAGREGSAEACAAALPPAPPAPPADHSPAARAGAAAAWALAQLRHGLVEVWLVADEVLKKRRLPDRRRRRGHVTLLYKPIPADAVVRAWLALPQEERPTRADAALDTLCALEAELLREKAAAAAPAQHTEL